MNTRQEIFSEVRDLLFDALRDAPSTDISGIGPYDTENEWVLAPEVLQFIAALIARLSPKHVVEFGSGVSTRVLAMTATRLETPCRVSSIDHDPEFGAAALPAALEHPGAEKYLRLQIAPLVAREILGKVVPVYYIDREEMASDHPADLLIIDGPPDALGGREGTLYQAMELLRPGSIVLLDDAGREAEQDACRNWRDNFAEAIELIDLPGFKRGLVAIIIRRPIAINDLWSYLNRDIWRELESVIPSDIPCILINDNSFHPGSISSLTILPFLEKEGEYWGVPGSDAEAIRELDRMKNEGAGFLAITRPSLWWRDHYAGFLEHLHATYSCVLENDRAVVFDLR